MQPAMDYGTPESRGDSSPGQGAAATWLHHTGSPAPPPPPPPPHPPGEFSKIKSAQRRAKRIIPENEKDEKYWEKRKRNNMAAKRSRENKRLVERAVRQSVQLLREENALLRQELLVVKERFGLPATRCLLSADQRSQCLQEVRTALNSENMEQHQTLKHASDVDLTPASSGPYPLTVYPGSNPQEKTLHSAAPPGLCAGQHSSYGGSSNGQGGLNRQSGTGAARLKYEPPGYRGTDSLLPHGINEYGLYASMTTSNPLWGFHGGQHGLSQSFPEYSNVAQLNQPHHPPQQYQHEQPRHQHQQHQHQSTLSSYHAQNPTKLLSISDAFQDKVTSLANQAGYRYQVPTTATTTNNNNVSNKHGGVGASTTSGSVMFNRSHHSKDAHRTSYTYYKDTDFSPSHTAYSPTPSTTSTTITTTSTTLPSMEIVPAGALSMGSSYPGVQSALGQPKPRQAGDFHKSFPRSDGIRGIGSVASTLAHSSPSLAGQPVHPNGHESLDTFLDMDQDQSSSLCQEPARDLAVGSEHLGTVLTDPGSVKVVAP